MRKGIAILLCLVAAAVAADVYNFNIDWKFKKLPMGIAGLPAARKAIMADGKEFFDRNYPDSRWETVSVPHSVNAHDSYDGPSVWWGEEKFFRGWMFYRKRFVPPKGKRFFLEFEAVRSSVYLWVNGKYIGCYEAGIAASGYDITAALCDGENVVAVATENAAARAAKIYAAETSPGGEPGDWKGTVFQWDSTDYNPVQGGLTGNVNLHVKKSDSYFTLPLYETLRTSGTYIYAKDFDFAKGAATVCVEPEIAGKGNVRFSVAGHTFTGTTARVDGLKFWSPDTPHLYDVKIGLFDDVSGATLDEITIRTGFRHVAYSRDKGGVLINGKSTWLPGYAQRSTDSWAAIGVAPDWVHDFEAELIRESNANFVRWMHVAPKPGPVRAFDRAGVVNVCPAGDTEKDSEGRQWEHRIEAMRAVITYFRNSPSILFWEAGNNRISPAHMRQMRLLKEELDPHGGRFMGCRTMTTPEEIAEAEYVGTMLHRYDKRAQDSMEKLGRFMPILESEYCREESARRLWDRYSPPDYNFVCKRLSSGAKRNGYNCFDMTQEEMAVSNGAVGDGYGYFYGNRVSGSLGRYYSGCAILCWSDCNQHGRNSNTENCRSSGRVDAVRIPKGNFYAHQCFYSRVPRVKILGHWNYPKLEDGTYWYNEAVNDGKEITYTGRKVRRDPTRKPVMVIASVHCDSVELLVNGRSKGVLKEPSGLFDFVFANVDVTESGRVEAVARDAKGNVIARDAIETAGPAAFLKMTVHTGPGGLRADGSDIAIVDLALVDSAGRTLPLAGNRVDFSLSGPAKFMGGWNSGTFGDKSPVGKDWVNLECGVNRVFVKGGRRAGVAKLVAVCGKFSATALISVKNMPFVNGVSKVRQQSRDVNVLDYSVEESHPSARDLNPVSPVAEYVVSVNGRKVAFDNVAKPFKPDVSTGVCASLEPVLKAVKEAGAEFAYAIHPNGAPQDRTYLREMGMKGKSMIAMKIGKKSVDVVAGSTEIFENGGKVRNLTNFEFAVVEDHIVGELAYVLGYIPGVEVRTDDKRCNVEITVNRVQSIK